MGGTGHRKAAVAQRADVGRRHLPLPPLLWALERSLALPCILRPNKMAGWVGKLKGEKIKRNNNFKKKMLQSGAWFM